MIKAMSVSVVVMFLMYATYFAVYSSPQEAVAAYKYLTNDSVIKNTLR